MLFLIVGCATSQVERVKKTYSKSDYELIKPHLDSYSDLMSKAIGMGAYSSIGSQRRDIAAQGNLQTVYCNCVKSLGASVCDSTNSQEAKDKQIWAKGRAAREVISTFSGTMLGMQDVAKSEFCSL